MTTQTATRSVPIGDAQVSEETGAIAMLASTSNPMRWGDWTESLSHASDAIDTSACRSLLLNHDPDQLVGVIRSLDADGSALFATAEIDADAETKSGISVRAAVASGALRGVSIRYAYNTEDTSWDRDTRALTVHKWRLLEVTLTPIPADPAGQVRSAPFGTEPAITGDTLMANEEKPAVTAGDDVAALRSKVAKLEQEQRLRSLAADHGIDAKGIDFGSFADEAAGQRALMAKLAEQLRAQPAIGVTRTEVIADAADKRAAKAAVALYAAAGIDATGRDAKLIEKHGAERCDMRSIVAEYAALDGVSSNKLDTAAWLQRNVDLSTFGGKRDAANGITASFPKLLANVANAALQNGLSSYNASTWQIWATQRLVSDFKQVSNAGLSSGLLEKTPENNAFPELNSRDGGYNSQLGLYGATISLTYQAIVNDQLGQFFARLQNAGAIAAATVDREVYNVLLNATWTNDVTGGAALGVSGNLDKTRAALATKLSPAGEPMGIVARYLLHAPNTAVAAGQDTGAIFAPGQANGGSVGTRSVIPVESAHVGNTVLYGGALTTDYYLTGNPQVIDTVLVNFLEGVGFQAVITPYDAGAVAAEKWKIQLPFTATVATHDDSAGNTRVSGIQKGKVAS